MLARHHQDLWIIPTSSGKSSQLQGVIPSDLPMDPTTTVFSEQLSDLLNPSRSSRFRIDGGPPTPTQRSGSMIILSIWQTHGVEHVSQHD